MVPGGGTWTPELRKFALAPLTDDDEPAEEVKMEELEEAVGNAHLATVEDYLATLTRKPQPED
jgi:hypothetical protein